MSEPPTVSMPAGTPARTRPSPRRTLYSADALAMLPPPEYLVEGVLPVGAPAVLFGPSNSYKTFCALDLGMCVATGINWHGRTVKQAQVVYVAGEGFYGYVKRIAAWKEEHVRAGMPFFLFDNTVRMLDVNDVDAFIQQIHEAGVKPGLVVLDTLSRAFVGGDENSQRDMAAFVAAVDRIRREFGATVLVVHHSGKEGSQERGSSVLRCDFDVMMKVSANRKARRVEIQCVKMRDFDHFSDLVFTVAELAGYCVLRASDPTGQPSLTVRQRKSLTALLSTPDGNGLRFNAWARAAEVGNASLSRDKTRLIELGYVEFDEASAAYRATQAGVAALQGEDSHRANPGIDPASGPAPVASTVHGTAENRSNTAHGSPQVVSHGPLLSEKGPANHSAPRERLAEANARLHAYRNVTRRRARREVIHG